MIWDSTLNEGCSLSHLHNAMTCLHCHFHLYSHPQWRGFLLKAGFQISFHSGNLEVAASHQGHPEMHCCWCAGRVVAVLLTKTGLCVLAMGKYLGSKLMWWGLSGRDGEALRINPLHYHTNPGYQPQLEMRKGTVTTWSFIIILLIFLFLLIIMIINIIA